MGWDAYAVPIKRLYRWQGYSSDCIADREQDAAFESAAHWVMENAGSVDGFLRQGGLDCSDCGVALENATGQSAWPDDEVAGRVDWTPDVVQELARNAYWEFEAEPWAKLSARMFLETTARLGLSVRFSW